MKGSVFKVRFSKNLFAANFKQQLVVLFSPILKRS